MSKKFCSLTAVAVKGPDQTDRVCHLLELHLSVAGCICGQQGLLGRALTPFWRLGVVPSLSAQHAAAAYL